MLDGDGNQTGRFRVEPMPRIVVTVTAVEDVDVIATPETVFAPYRHLTPSDARSCGEQSVADLRSWWRERHPRNDFAQLVRFSFGDVRDRDIFLNPSNAAGGDYTRNPKRSLDPDAPCLTPPEYDGLGVAARQREAGRARDAERLLRQRSLRDRAEWISLAAEEVKLDVSDELDRVAAMAARATRKIDAE